MVSSGEASVAAGGFDWHNWCDIKFFGKLGATRGNRGLNVVGGCYCITTHDHQPRGTPSDIMHPAITILTTITPIMAIAITSWVALRAVSRQLAPTLHAHKVTETTAIAQSLLDTGGISQLNDIGVAILPVDGDGRLLGEQRRTKWAMTIITVDITGGKPKVAHVRLDFSTDRLLAANVARALQNINTAITLADGDRLELKEGQEQRFEKFMYLVEYGGYHILLGIMNVKELKRRRRRERLRFNTIKLRRNRV